MTRKKILIALLVMCVVLCVLGVGTVVAVNCVVIGSVSDYLLSEQDATALGDVDCVIVLGCQVHNNGSPSHMLEDRLKKSISLYHSGAAPKIIMSGDHGTPEYDEVDAMKHYAVDAGVPSADVFMDHAGFSTYETMYRAKEVFCAQKVLIVTQEYHLYRSVYIARALGMDAYGVACDYRTYAGQTMRDLREILARVKDFGMTILKPAPTYLGETIPVSGDGGMTHDENSNFG